MFDTWGPRAIAALSFTLVAGGVAAEPSFWVGCDGYGKPEAQSSKLGRGLASALSLGLVAMPETYDPGGRAPDLAGVAACNEALENVGQFPDSWLRRASLLEARAIHNIEADHTREAQKDVDAARETAGAQAADIHFARSTGLSLDLLQSYLSLRDGEDSEASRLAARAAAARPFSSGVQRLALFLMSFDDDSLKEQGAVAEQLDRLNPAVRADTSYILWRLGRFPQAWANASPLFGAGSSWADDAPIALDLDELQRSYLAAYSAARADQSGAARAVLATSRRRVAGAIEIRDRNSNPPTYSSRKDMDRQRSVLLDRADAWDRIIDAAILFQSKQTLAAQTLLLERSNYPASSALLSLIGDLRAELWSSQWRGMTATDPSVLTELVQGSREKRIPRISDELFSILPQPEDVHMITRYSGQMFLSFKQGGFTERQLGNGSTEITFKANLFSREAADEMVLLRAADLAERAGKQFALIDARHDYTRWSQTMRGGVSQGPKVQVGYESVIEVRFGEAGIGAPAINVGEVNAALGPIYLPAKPKTP